ncbi:npc intracellular cholesterol transporter 1 [Anaeramoeba ignava]|uniref:Npc intracellular cholesterol transporter 1 n=1 Tax=Anaeramoeba ignava TaxID=1746090 RepID=A0A9Q0LQ03_ANAIG|nr:npc intracellular cholesterol transporter 1 [Anaeramoeba ignava]
MILLLLILFLSSFCLENQCRFQGNPPLVWEKPPQPYNLTNLACFEYYDYFDGHVCCNASQALFFKENFAEAVSFFGSCSACLKNIYFTWCNYACHPNQSDYVNSSNHVNGEPLQNPTFKICRRWAKQVYESCQFVPFVSAMWPTYVAFWLTQAASAIPVPVTLEFPPNDQDDDPNYWCPLDKIRPCQDECDCLVCPSACEGTNDISYIDNDCKVGKLSCFTFYLILGCSFIGFAFLFSIIRRIIFRNKKVGFEKKPILN